MRLNAVEFGAVGDGVTMNTEALTRALAALREAGGGELYLPAGVYLSGALELVSHLKLVLEAGAVLKASPDIADHWRDPRVTITWLAHSFLYGCGLEDVTIAGEGVIDGNGWAYWQREYFSGDTDETIAPDQPIINYHVYKPLAERPVVVSFIESTDIRILGVTLRDAAAYTVWTIGCRRVLIDGITIRNPRNGPNTDALDIDCCDQVRIVNCDIEAGDDCVALKSDPNRLGLQGFFPCRRIVVSNCVFSSSTCAIRIGYEGDAPIQDCVFSDLVIYDSRHGIDILSITPVSAIKIEHGTPIDNLRFHNIVMRNVGQAFFIWAGNESPRTEYSAHIRNLSFSDMTIESVATSYIGSELSGVISDLRFRDIVMHVADLPEVPVPANLDAPLSHWGDQWRSGGLRFRNVDAVEMERVRVTCDQPGFEAIRFE